VHLCTYVLPDARLGTCNSRTVNVLEYVGQMLDLISIIVGWLGILLGVVVLLCTTYTGCCPSSSICDQVQRSGTLIGNSLPTLN
jgi:hypothetical protein